MIKPTYIIVGWDKNFECAQSRKIIGPLKWVSVPVHHDGAAYRRVMRLPNGPLIYACWILILQVAAKCPVRGVLVGDHGPLDADELSIRTDCPEALFVTALEVLSSPEIGWLRVTSPENGSVVADSGSVLPASTTTVADSGNGQPASTTAPAYRKEGREERKNVNRSRVKRESSTRRREERRKGRKEEW